MRRNVAIVRPTVWLHKLVWIVSQPDTAVIEGVLDVPFVAGADDFADDVVDRLVL